MNNDGKSISEVSRLSGLPRAFISKQIKLGVVRSHLDKSGRPKLADDAINTLLDLSKARGLGLRPPASSVTACISYIEKAGFDCPSSVELPAEPSEYPECLNALFLERYSCVFLFHPSFMPRDAIRDLASICIANQVDLKIVSSTSLGLSD